MKESRGKGFSNRGSEGGREKKDFSRDKKSSFGGEKKSFSGNKSARPRFNDDNKKGFDGEKRSFSSDRGFKPRFNDDRKSSFDGEKRGFSSDRGSKPRFDDDRKRSFDGEKRSFSSDRSSKPRFNDDRKRSFDGEKRGFSSDRSSKPRFNDDRSGGFDRERKNFLGGRKSSYSNDEGFEGKKPYGRRDSDSNSDGAEERGYRKDFGSNRFGDKPRRSFDRDGDKPRRSFGNDGDKPRRSYNNDDENSGERKSFRNNSYDNKSKKPYGKKYEGDRTERKPSFSENFEYKKHYQPNRTQILEKEGDGLIRLNKYIANSGVCSRREADELIATGVVKVNGEIITELGYKIKPDDRVHFGDRLIRGEKPVYILLNKPKDFITTSKDPQNRRTVLDLLTTVKERVFPVGRLDRNTTGLLVITNDGDLAEKLTHPSKNVEKIYHVELDKKLTEQDFKQFEAGVELEDGFFKPDEIAYVEGESKAHVGVKLHSGKNRIVRRYFEALNYKVIKLDRVVYAGLTKKGLPRGKYRMLQEEEVAFLKRK